MEVRYTAQPLRRLSVMVTSLSVADITRVAKEAVAAELPGYEVVGVTGHDRDGEYAEVLIRVLDCQQQPCLIEVGIFRDADETGLRREITEKVKASGGGQKSMPPPPRR